MTVFYAALRGSFLGYCAVFACISLGFLFLRQVASGEVGPGHWALGFLLNALGFLAWSGTLPLVEWQYLLLGEVLHVAGFVVLICGIFRFGGRTYRVWNLITVCACLAVWLCAIFIAPGHETLSAILLKLVRAGLFISAAASLLWGHHDDGRFLGRRIAGTGTMAWGLYILFLAFLRIGSMLDLAFGFLVGFQVLAAFGFVAMVVDGIRKRAEDSERRNSQLEGLLPICAYCKKIRDKDNRWHTVEAYIEDHSGAEFSHGICPECFEKHRPDR